MHDMQPLTYSVGEVQRLLGISRAFVYRLIHLGELPVIRLGGGKRFRIPVRALERLLAAGEPAEGACDEQGR